MATPQTEKLHLYLRGDSAPAQTVGNVRVTGIEADSAGQGLRLTLAPEAARDLPAAMRWVDLRAHLSSNRTRARSYGRVSIEYEGWPDFRTGRTSFWTWRLHHTDLDAIEVDRADAPGAPVSFRLLAEGSVALDTSVWGIGGETQLTLPASEWHGLLERLEYRTPTHLIRLAGEAVVAHPSWADAEGRLDLARRHLRVGNDEEALAAAFREFERLSESIAPYRPNAWENLAPGAVEAKRRDLREMVAAHAMYLNRLGRHLDPQTGLPGERASIGVDHWEAELLLATSQLLLAAVIRYRAEASA